MQSFASGWLDHGIRDALLALFADGLYAFLALGLYGPRFAGSSLLQDVLFLVPYDLPVVFLSHFVPSSHYTRGPKAPKRPKTSRVVGIGSIRAWPAGYFHLVKREARRRASRRKPQGALRTGGPGCLWRGFPGGQKLSRHNYRHEDLTNRERQKRSPEPPRVVPASRRQASWPCRGQASRFPPLVRIVVVRHS
jgi:hypothetical protein